MRQNTQKKVFTHLHLGYPFHVSAQRTHQCIVGDDIRFHIAFAHHSLGHHEGFAGGDRLMAAMIVLVSVPNDYAGNDTIMAW